MTDTACAIENLKKNGIEAIEEGHMVVIPFDYISEHPDQLTPMIHRIKHVFKEIGYEKSWRIDPHYNKTQSMEDNQYGRDINT